MLIALNGISKSYQASHGAPPYQVLKDANLSIDKGEMVAIKGSSGAGKSTLMKCLFGIYSKDSGHIYLGQLSAERAGCVAVIAVQISGNPQRQFRVCHAAFRLD